MSSIDVWCLMGLVLNGCTHSQESVYVIQYILIKNLRNTQCTGVYVRSVNNNTFILYFWELLAQKELVIIHLHSCVLACLCATDKPLCSVFMAVLLFRSQSHSSDQ